MGMRTRPSDFMKCLQVAHLQMLAVLYEHQQEHSKAAITLELLATRQSGPGSQAIDIQDRLELYTQAASQVRNATSAHGNLDV